RLLYGSRSRARLPLVAFPVLPRAPWCFVAPTVPLGLGVKAVAEAALAPSSLFPRRFASSAAAGIRPASVSSPIRRAGWCSDPPVGSISIYSFSVCSSAASHDGCFWVVFCAAPPFCSSSFSASLLPKCSGALVCSLKWFMSHYDISLFLVVYGVKEVSLFVLNFSSCCIIGLLLVNPGNCYMYTESATFFDLLDFGGAEVVHYLII
ncbi:hypothetical protein EJB05_44029, partial [Eragrostis curvula]